MLLILDGWLPPIQPSPHSYTPRIPIVSGAERMSHEPFRQILPGDQRRPCAAASCSLDPVLACQCRASRVEGSIILTSAILNLLQHHYLDLTFESESWLATGQPKTAQNAQSHSDGKVTSSLKFKNVTLQNVWSLRLCHICHMSSQVELFKFRKSDSASFKIKSNKKQTFIWDHMGLS